MACSESGQLRRLGELATGHRTVGLWAGCDSEGRLGMLPGQKQVGRPLCLLRAKKDEGGRPQPCGQKSMGVTDQNLGELDSLEPLQLVSQAHRN